MRLNSDISIKRKLNLLLVLIVTILLFAGVFSYLSINRIIAYSNYLENVKELKIIYLEIRKYENDFIINHDTNIDFFKTGTSPELKEHQKSFNGLIESITTLKINRLAKKFGITEHLSQITNYNNQYNQHFLELVKKFKEKGFFDYGAVGEMRDAIHSAEASTNNLTAQNLILTLRRHEKDFLLRNDLKYYAKTKQTLADFFAYAKTDTLNSNPELIQAIEAYHTYFDKVLAVSKEIGLNPNEGLKGQLAADIAKIEPIITQIDIIISGEIKETKSNTIRAILVLITILIGLITYTMYKLFATIMRPVNKLKKFIGQLGKGIIPDKFIEFKNRDEISEIGYEIKKLTDGLSQTTNFAIAIGKGNLEADFTPLSTQDTLGNSLLEMRESLKKTTRENRERRAEEDKQNWATKGLAALGEILRTDNDDLQTLSYNIISNLVSYLDASQGFIYILKDENQEHQSETIYELKAAVAYDRRKYLEGKIHPGQGIAGRCTLEKATIYITELPEDYVRITSGTGQTKPRALLVVPLKMNEKIYGVIEIAALQALEPHQIEFAEKAAQSVASTIASVRINLRTAQLLKESKLQAEELASKEEEMRQNMEELQATQEEAARKEAEATGFVNAVNHTIIRADFSLAGKIQYANSKFLELMQYNSKEVNEMHFSEFIEQKDLQKFQQQWDRLRQGGKHIEQEMRYKTKQSHVWVLATYTPIRDRQGDVVKILYLAIDIDQQKRINLDFEEELKAIKRSVLKAEFSPQGKLLDANEIYLKNFGYQHSELQTHTVFSTIPKAKILQFENHWAQITDGIPYQAQIKRIGKNGQERYLQGTYTAVKDFDEKVYKIVFIAYDITPQIHQQEENKRLLQAYEKQATELKAKEEAMIQNMEEMQQIQEGLAAKEAEMRGQLDAINTTNALIEYSLSGRVLSANEIFCELFGYLQNDIAGQHHRLFVDEQTKKSPRYKAFWKELTSGTPQAGEFKRIRRDNSEIYLKGVYNPVFDQDGKITKILMLGLDITDAKQRQAEVKGQWEAINKTNALIEYDLQGTIISVNELYSQLFGYKPEELIGRNHRIFFEKKEKNSEKYREFWLNLKNGHEQEGQYKQIDANSQEKYIRAVHYPIQNTEGKPYKVLELAIDMTPLKKQEESLKKALKDAEEREKQIKQQNKKLREQEDDLRLNMEELEATQEEMAEKQRMLQQKAQQEQQAQEKLSQQLQRYKKIQQQLDAAIREKQKQKKEIEKLEKQIAHLKK